MAGLLFEIHEVVAVGINERDCERLSTYYIA